MRGVWSITPRPVLSIEYAILPFYRFSPLSILPFYHFIRHVAVVPIPHIKDFSAPSVLPLLRLCGATCFTILTFYHFNAPTGCTDQPYFHFLPYSRRYVVYRLHFYLFISIPCYTILKLARPYLFLQFYLFYHF